MNAVQGQTITSGSTNETLLRLTDVDSNSKQKWYFTILTGTSLKIATEAGGCATAHAWTSDQLIPPFETKDGKIYFQASGAADTFTVTATT